MLPGLPQLAAAFTVTVAYFVVPFALLGAALASSSAGPALLAAASCAVVYSTHAFFSIRASRVWYFPLAPVSGLLVAAAFLAGFVRFRRGGITWKGVKYASDRFKPLA